MAKDPKSVAQERPTEGRVPMLTVDHIPTEQLIEEQGIDGPQGIDWIPLLGPWTEVD
jgi:hypothetical protein